MLKLRLFPSILSLLVLPALAPAADQGLLRLVMPDAKVVAGLQVDRTRDSAFGQFVLSHMQLDDPAFQKFVAGTGFDPRKDVKELIIASNWQVGASGTRWLVLGKGTFDLPKIQHAAEDAGVAMTRYQGASMFSFAGHGAPDTDNSIAFLDASSAVMGDAASVKAAIQRKQNNAEASSDLVGKVKDLSAKNDFWFVTLVPLSEFALDMPDPNLGGAMRGNTLSAINEARGGVRFGATVTISADVVTRSDKDALALVDVVKFLVGMLQLNRQDNPVAGQVSTLLDPLETKTAGNVMSMSLAVPEQQLERLFNNVGRSGRPATPAAPKKNPPQGN
jgi:hypothetical protein